MNGNKCKLILGYSMNLQRNSKCLSRSCGYSVKKSIVVLIQLLSGKFHSFFSPGETRYSLFPSHKFTRFHRRGSDDLPG